MGRSKGTGFSKAWVPAWAGIHMGNVALDTSSQPPRPDLLRFRMNMELAPGSGGEAGAGPLEVRPRRGFIPLWYNGVGEPGYWNKDVDLRSQGLPAGVYRQQIRVLDEFVTSDGDGKLWAFGVRRAGSERNRAGAWVLSADTTDLTWRPVEMPEAWFTEGFDWASGRAVPRIAQMHDKLVYVARGTKPFAIDMLTLQPAKIPSLTEGGAGLDPVAEASVALAHKGMVLLMNLRMGGVDCPTRVLWSDINRLYFGLNTLDGVAPVTGWQDLEYGDEIVAAGELHDQVVIYTRRAIWTMRFLPTSNSLWMWRKAYEDKSGRVGLPEYRNSLVSDGRHHYYVGRDGIYRYNPTMSQPERLAWLDAASGLLFQPTSLLRIDPVESESVIGARIPGSDEIWFSWLTPGHGAWTLSINVNRQYADYMDVGWTAIGQFRAFGRREAIPVGVLYDDNTIKHLQVSRARWIYDVPVQDRLKSLAGQKAAQQGQLVMARGFVPGAGGTHRSRLTQVRVEAGALTGDAIGLGLRTVGVSRLVDPVLELSGGNALPWVDWGTVTIHHQSTGMEILAWNTQTEGVYILWELTVGAPTNTSALMGASIALGSLLFEYAPVGITPY